MIIYTLQAKKDSHNIRMSTYFSHVLLFVYTTCYKTHETESKRLKEFWYFLPATNDQQWAPQGVCVDPTMAWSGWEVPHRLSSLSFAFCSSEITHHLKHKGPRKFSDWINIIVSRFAIFFKQKRKDKWELPKFRHTRPRSQVTSASETGCFGHEHMKCIYLLCLSVKCSI